MSQTPAQWQWTPADEKQLRQLREKGVSLDEIAKMFHRGHSAVARKCRAMGLTNQALRRVAPSPKAALSDKRATDAVKRAGKTTLPPLPSLRDE
jgi:IS30 family transposase